MRQCARMMSTEAMKTTGLWARRLEQDAVLELDVVEPETLEPDVAKCIHEPDVVEGRMAMSKAMSKGFGGKKVYTKGVFSSENSSATTGKKEVWCIPKTLFSREKEGKYVYTKAPSRCLWGTPSRSIGV